MKLGKDSKTKTCTELFDQGEDTPPGPPVILLKQFPPIIQKSIPEVTFPLKLKLPKTEVFKGIKKSAGKPSRFWVVIDLKTTMSSGATDENPKPVSPKLSNPKAVTRPIRENTIRKKIHFFII